MKIYNTLHGRKEEFVPLHEGKVGIYVCGPTVYNLIHIGNARPMVIFDTLRNYLEFKGYEVNYVSNFTDVDDKIIRKAMESGQSAKEVAETFIKECQKDMKALNVRPSTVSPRATEEIPEMIAMIQGLIEKGHAYVVDGTVYFRTSTFDEYGKLSKKNIEDLRSGNRDLLVSGEETKQDPTDFVLWKPKKEGEPSWSSPWGEGRPGWHIECSAMSLKYIGEELDIHAGGEDLVFPHHENEIAQSECFTHHAFAKYWMHNAFLLIDRHKMSKSENNFRTVREITEAFDPRALRLFLLSAHYRTPLNYVSQDGETMQSMLASLERIMTCEEDLRRWKKDAPDGDVREEVLRARDEIHASYMNAMEDDLNTADALSSVFDLVSYLNKEHEKQNRKELELLHEELLQLLGILGLTVNPEETIDAKVEALIAERQEARKNKDFKRADEIRDMLLEMGISLKDTRQGVVWQKISS